MRSLLPATVALALCAAVSASAATQSPLTRIAFGSCARQNQPQPIWDIIAAENPDMMLMIGDNIYGDTHDMDTLREKYQKLADKPEFASFRKIVPFDATWDDHDFGANDAGTEYSKKKESQQIFLDFWGYPADDPLRKQEGIYHSRMLGSGDRTVQIILLDTRYDRGPLKWNIFGYVADPNSTSQFLSEKQWSWLKTELEKPAAIRIIASSIQFVANDHRSEKWGNLPKERQRMLDLIKITRASGVVFISGDRHQAEISRIPASYDLYPIYDITSSGLTQYGDAVTTEKNVHRIATKGAYKGGNFGLVEIDWEDTDGPSIKLEVIDRYGKIFAQHEIPLSDLASR